MTKQQAIDTIERYIADLEKAISIERDSPFVKQRAARIDAYRQALIVIRLIDNEVPGGLENDRMSPAE